MKVFCEKFCKLHFGESKKLQSFFDSGKPLSVINPGLVFKALFHDVSYDFLTI